MITRTWLPKTSTSYNFVCECVCMMCSSIVLMATPSSGCSMYQTSCSVGTPTLSCCHFSASCQRWLPPLWDYIMIGSKAVVSCIVRLCFRFSILDDYQSDYSILYPLYFLLVYGCGLIPDWWEECYVNINSSSFSTYGYFGDIIEMNFTYRPWYDATQSPIGSGVEVNWPSKSFSLL